MKDLIVMWKNPRMVVLTAVCAAVYVAAMLPFKWAIIIPGLAEVRPATVFPILFSFLFGPAGAWGSAIGNLVGDMLGGMLGPGSIPGFLANFTYGYLPYKLWESLFPGRTVIAELQDFEKRMHGPWRLLRGPGLALAFCLLLWAAAVLVAIFTGMLNDNGAPAGVFENLSLSGPALLILYWTLPLGLALSILAFFSPWRIMLTIGVASMSCALIVAWGVELLGILPFPVLGIWILVNNLAICFLLLPPIMILLHPRTANQLMLYSDLLGERKSGGMRAKVIGIAVIFVMVAAYSMGLFLGPESLMSLVGDLAGSDPGWISHISQDYPYFIKSALIFPLIVAAFLLMLML